MRLISQFLIRLTARPVGSDAYGNRYYQARRPDRLGRYKRFVLYNGVVEASKVPADWHGWLHYIESTPPPAGGYPQRVWQKDHLPNTTGTIYAHRPRGGIHSDTPQPATGAYQPWTPE